jgi:CBS-domain-containing membrane protein
MEIVSFNLYNPLMAVPFATSIVLVLGMPEAEPSQPRALVGGHIVATLVGLIFVKLVGPTPWTAALAVGVAIAAMQLTGTFHPPAGIDPLVVVVNGMSWSFLMVPVAVVAGSLVVALRSSARAGLRRYHVAVNLGAF